MILMLLPVCARPGQETVARRVKFQRGRSTAVLKGKIVGGSMDLYVLGARAAQRMAARISSPGGGARFDLHFRRDQATLESVGPEQTTAYEGDLPETGDYVITVYSDSGDSEYQVEVSIQ